MTSSEQPSWAQRRAGPACAAISRACRWRPSRRHYAHGHDRSWSTLRTRGEAGGAIVEFHLLGVLLLVPVVYILLTVLDVQRASYGVTQAAREAGRLYVVTGDEAAAQLAASTALRDQGLEPEQVTVAFACSATPCHQPGAEVTVTVGTDVALPAVPDVLAGNMHARVPVSATHVAVVDRYRGTP